MKVILHIDGGSRGNPGPASIGVVVTSPEGEVLKEVAEYIGVATNNVAEYRALLRGLEVAFNQMDATEVEVINDSKLIACQVNGQWRVKHQEMYELWALAKAWLGCFEKWSIRNVPREQNRHADSLCNLALDRAA